MTIYSTIAPVTEAHGQCPRCGKTSRGEYDGFCSGTCLDQYPLDAITPEAAPHVNDTRVIDAMAGYVACTECAGTSGNVRTGDRVRGQMHNGWCIRCDGDQSVFIGRRAALISISA